MDNFTLAGSWDEVAAAHDRLELEELIRTQKDEPEFVPPIPMQCFCPDRQILED